jgi:hypothetical protein
MPYVNDAELDRATIAVKAGKRLGKLLMAQSRRRVTVSISEPAHQYEPGRHL